MNITVKTTCSTLFPLQSVGTAGTMKENLLDVDNYMAQVILYHIVSKLSIRNWKAWFYHFLYLGTNCILNTCSNKRYVQVEKLDRLWKLTEK